MKNRGGWHRYPPTASSQEAGFAPLREPSQSFTSIASYGPNTESNVSSTDGSERVFGSVVTVNTLDTLGIRPELGSFFLPENTVAGEDQVVVLSDGHRRERFGANPQIIGQSVRIDDVSRQIMGVMPPGIGFPYSDTRFVVPVAFKGGDPVDAWSHPFNLRAVGRLRDRVTFAAAQAELRRLHPSLLRLFQWRMPDSWAADITVVSFLDSVVGDTRPRLLPLFGTVALILLIACANVANLMLARAGSREREMAVRGAVGASATRIIGQLLVESILLAGLARIVGLVCAAISFHGLIRLMPADTPRISNVALRWDVFLFAALTSVVTGVVFGLVPALRMASPIYKARCGLQAPALPQEPLTSGFPYPSLWDRLLCRW